MPESIRFVPPASESADASSSASRDVVRPGSLFHGGEATEKEERIVLNHGLHAAVAIRKGRTLARGFQYSHLHERAQSSHYGRAANRQAVFLVLRLAFGNFSA